MKKKLSLLGVLLALVSSVLLLTGCSVEVLLEDVKEVISTPSTQPAATGDLSVYYLDVGQGDSELIYLPDGTTVLIDSGDRDCIDAITPALKSYGVKKIDILIGTHPHADHIGCMATVVRNFKIGSVYLPKVAAEDTPTTVSYEKLLEAISKKNLKIKTGKAGVTAYDKNGVKLEFVSPKKTKYDELNNYSIVAKLTYGKTGFLFMGDAEVEAINEMLSSGADLRADVLKIGHHGSHNATTKELLKAVNPQIAVISCGKGNSYGHPHREVKSLLKKNNIETFRTDEKGTILATSNGKTIQMKSGLPSVQDAA